MERVIVVGCDETPAGERALAVAADAAALGGDVREVVTAFASDPREVVTHLLDRTDCPVLIPGPDGRRERGRITVAVDLDEPTEELLAFAFSEACDSHKALHVVNVWASHLALFYDAMFENEFTADASIVAHREADLLAELEPWKVRYPDVVCSYEVQTGSIGKSLTDASKDADMLIVGGRRHGDAPGVKAGPVVQTLLCHAACTLAVVPTG